MGRPGRRLFAPSAFHPETETKSSKKPTISLLRNSFHVYHNIIKELINKGSIFITGLRGLQLS